MPKFKVGDMVARINPIIPGYTQRGIIMQVITNENGPSQYEASFSTGRTSCFYESELRLIPSPDTEADSS